MVDILMMGLKFAGAVIVGMLIVSLALIPYWVVRWIHHIRGEYFDELDLSLPLITVVWCAFLAGCIAKAAQLWLIKG